MTSHASKLDLLRRRLADLRRARQTVRWGTAYSASLVAVLLLLGALWALDVMFELSVLQRAVMIVVAALGAVWSFVRYTRPLLGVTESEVDLALQVERLQGIDSDLVAALQFESPAAAGWGSQELSSAVIDRVSTLGANLDVFRGFSREQLRRRALALGLTLAAVVAAALLFPQHARVFLNRLLLGNRHYPTRTVLERIVVGDSTVLAWQMDDTQPRSIAAAQGQNLAFLAVCSGELPSKVTARIQALAGGTSRVVELTAVEEAERQQRLQQVQSRLQAQAQAQAQTQAAEVAAETEETASLLATLEAELPAVAQRWREAVEARATWSDVAALFDESYASWQQTASKTQLYRGELGRLVDSARYKLQAGDAWTDPADIQMTPRPIVELNYTTESPDYARGTDAIRELGPRQLSVLEGSKVDVQISSANGKKLKEAWLTWNTAAGTQRITLIESQSDGLSWKLPNDAPPFVSVANDLRFAVQVRDFDGLGLETPLAGVIRIKSDRPPSGSLDVVHKVVLPTAKPVVNLRASDDYGIAKILLHLEHERAENVKRLGESATTSGGSATDSPNSPSSETVEARRQTVVVHANAPPLRSSQLPFIGQQEVPLAPLAMTKGDRLRITLEIIDDRGSKTGESYLSEPLYLEISDEAGVLTAILEADEKSEQRLSDLIKRQLGIREAP